MKPGEAAIKEEYLVKKEVAPDKKETVHDEKPQLKGDPDAVSAVEEKDKENEASEPAKKKSKKGQNKARPRTVPKTADNLRICPTIHQNVPCRFGDKCKFLHDPKKYLESKPPDIGPECVNYKLYGKCKFGVECRYGKEHITDGFQNKVDEEKYLEYLRTHPEKDQNVLTKSLMNVLRKKGYKYEKTEFFLKTMNIKDTNPRKSTGVIKTNNADNPQSGITEIIDVDTGVNETNCVQTIGAFTDEDLVKPRPCEKKKIDFNDKLYLAPLTTVGNLPFRRVCKQLGADITCGEMAMSTNLLQGSQGEWALLRRHPSEDIFGVQICGGYPDSMSKVAELISTECNVDFIDINMGCPIDLVFKKGEGSALMGRLSKLENIVRGMVQVSDVPITIKMRTGIYENKNTAHKVVPILKEWGVSAMTLHGRTREQRYTKAADWSYIDQCAQLSDPIPFFGNGDILSYEDANLHREKTSISGLMIARGALIKPWIFTEIKEQRHWDISSTERFEMLKEFADYGLQHWGSDNKGVENTRRFMLEWISFLHRYIPVGVLEQPPQKINERPPAYIGRNDMETMLASRNAMDWVKISEMILGPVPDQFNFLPKHKANSYT